MRAGFPGRMTAAAGRGSFSPGRLYGLQIWLDDTSDVTIATGVSQWNDKSGNANHATQGTAASQPTLSTDNNKRSLTFDGTDDTLAFPNLGLNGTSSNTLFFVCYIDSTTSGFDNPLAFGSGSEGRLETSSAGGDVLKSVNLGIRTADTSIWSGSIDDVLNIYTLHTDGTTVTGS